MSTDPTVKPDCANCPAFLKASDVPGRYGRATGSDHCVQFGTVLSKPSAKPSENKKLRQHIASKCPKFMSTSLPVEAGREMTVLLPDPVLRDSSMIDPAMQNGVNTCAMCKNYVNESIVVNELGWTSGLCLAKGKLILTNRQSIEARGCEYRQFGTPIGTTGGLHLLPEYTEEFLAGTASPVDAYFAAKSKGFIEPGDWLTDKEVTEGDKTAGIKAWRKFTDPDGSGNAVYFPVYDQMFFDDQERALIPVTGSDEHPELYVDHFGGMYGLGVAWLELDETPVMWGQPGVGKTELFRYAAWIMQVPFRRISFNKRSELEDIIGKMMYSPEKGTYFQYGRLPKAWTKPGVLGLDEPNTSAEEVWQAIRPLTDNSKQLVIDQNESEILDRHDDCYMGMAMNPAWDVRNVGALEIADADSNRLFHTEIRMPPEALEREIIKSHVALDGWEPTMLQLNRMMGVARDLRSLSESEGFPVTWALRQQIKVARTVRWFSPLVAYRRAVGDYLDPENKQILLDVVKAHFPDEDN